MLASGLYKPHQDPVPTILLSGLGSCTPAATRTTTTSPAQLYTINRNARPGQVTQTCVARGSNGASMGTCVGISRARSSMFNFFLQTYLDSLSGHLLEGNWFDWSMQVQVFRCNHCRMVLILWPVDRLRVLLAAHGQTWPTGKTMTTTWEMIRCQRHGNLLQSVPKIGNTSWKYVKVPHGVLCKSKRYTTAALAKASSTAGFHGKFACQLNIHSRFLCHLTICQSFFRLPNMPSLALVSLGVFWDVARQQQWIDSQKSWSLERTMHWACGVHIHIQRDRTWAIHLDKHAKTNQ